MPVKQLRGKALKLLQVEVRPSANGFGIDLSELNGVVSVVKGGAADTAGINQGDIIVGVDGVNIGARKLVDVLSRGKKSYIFKVVRPSLLMPGDKPNELPEAPEPLEPSPQPTSADVSPEGEAQVDDDGGDGSLKRSLEESLGRLQALSATLSTPTVYFIRIVPADSTAITVEWATRAVASSSTTFHLEWKAVGDSTWMASDASRSLKSTIVTKGNLKAGASYQFRVRARVADCNEWGPWSTPSEPLCPSMETSDQLSTIVEESTVVSYAAPSQLPGPGNDGSMGMDVVQSMLKDQRDALEVEHNMAIATLKSHLNQVPRPPPSTLRFSTVLRSHVLSLQELEETREEIQDWKQKFAEATGNSMQVVLEAKAATRDQVIAEFQAKTDEVEALRREAEQVVQKIRTAEAEAGAARAQTESYKVHTAQYMNPANPFPRQPSC